MKQFSNLAKGILISIASVMLVWLISSTLYTYTVSEEVTRLRRESRSDIVYLRNRVRDLEAALNPDAPAGITSPDASTDATVSQETSAPSRDTATNETEAVTVPTHQSPETQMPTVESPESLPAAAVYLFTEHNGVIGVFDAKGELIRTINVFVMTLPDAEREALEVGIPVFSYQEMCELAEQFE